MSLGCSYVKRGPPIIIALSEVHTGHEVSLDGTEGTSTSGIHQRGHLEFLALLYSPTRVGLVRVKR